MKIFITGSAGFIGTHLTDRLKLESHTVIGMDDLSHPCPYFHIPRIKDNILNIFEYEKQVRKCDWLVHLGAEINVEKSLKHPLKSIETNVLGTFNVLELARKLNKPVIYASTTEIYGDREAKKMNESHPMNPKSPYAASKMGADGLCKAYFHSYNLPIIIVRNFNTFGKYQSDDKWGAVIAKFADRLINNGSPIIYGDGKQKRDFMYYTDAIEFYMLCLNGKAKFGEDYNVGYGESISINQLAKKMIKIFGKPLTPIHIEPRPGEVRDFVCNNSKARKIGWKPKVDIDTGLKKYIKWKCENEYIGNNQYTK